MFQHVLVQGVRDLQLADECKCKYILTAVGNFGQLDLEVANIRLEVVTMSHLDREEVMIVLFGFSVGGVLGEKYFSYLLEVVERMGWQRVKSI